MNCRKQSLSIITMLWMSLNGVTPKPPINLTAFLQAELVERGAIDKLFFVPEDKVKQLLLALIESEQSEILAAQYRVTDKDLAQALIKAQQRGVKVEIITDKSCYAEPYEKVTKLTLNNIKVIPYSKPFSIMHHKYWIFKKNFANQQVLWTGSANGSSAGLLTNQEYVAVRTEAGMIKKFREHFVNLKNKILEDVAAKKKEQYLLTGRLRNVLRCARF